MLACKRKEKTHMCKYKQTCKYFKISYLVLVVTPDPYSAKCAIFLIPGNFVFLACDERFPFQCPGASNFAPPSSNALAAERGTQTAYRATTCWHVKWASTILHLFACLKTASTQFYLSYDQIPFFFRDSGFDRGQI